MTCLHMDTLILADQKKNYIHQLCVNIWYLVENLPRVVTDKDGW